jgi:hypothetical protein
MRIPARAPKYLLLAVGIGVLAVVALLLATQRGSAQHDGGYLEFAGPSSGWMEVPDDAALNPTGETTVEAWIYLDSYAGWGMDPSFTDCPMLVGKNWEMAYALALGCGGDVMDSFINANEHFQNDTTIPLSTWTHVAMTYDGTTRADYQNGTLLDDPFANDPIGAIGDTADPLRIGNDVNWDFSPNGRIDDVRIWNIARPQVSIQAGMNGVPSNAAGLVAQWTFDGGSLVDATNGFTGTLMGDVQIGGLGSETPTATPTPTGDTETPTPTGQTPTPTPTEPPSVTPSPTAAPALPGDVICDGVIKVDDAGFLLALRAVLNPTPGPFNCAPGADRADADCDGDSDFFDILAILKHVANLIQLATQCGTPTPSPTPTATLTPP